MNTYYDIHLQNLWHLHGWWLNKEISILVVRKDRSHSCLYNYFYSQVNLLSEWYSSNLWDYMIESCACNITERISWWIGDQHLFLDVISDILIPFFVVRWPIFLIVLQIWLEETVISWYTLLSYLAIKFYSAFLHIYPTLCVNKTMTIIQAHRQKKNYFSTLYSWKIFNKIILIV